MSHTRIAVFVALFGSIVTYETYRLFFVQHGAPRVTAARRHTTLIGGMSGDRTVAQTLLLDADGFNGITLQARAEGDAPAGAPRPGNVEGQVLVELYEEVPDHPRLIYRIDLPAQDLVARDRFHVTFPPIPDSRGRWFRLQVRAPTVPPDRALALVATLSNEYFEGRLFVDGREQWGDLVFETSAQQASGRWLLARLLPQGPWWLPTWSLAGAALLVWNALLAYACLVLVGLAHAERHPDRPRPLARPAPATRRVRPDLALANGGFAVALLVLVAVAAWPHPSEDEAVIDLLDRFLEAEKDTELDLLHRALMPDTVSILGERKAALRAHPPSAVAWTLQVPAEATFVSHVAFAPEAWRLPSDGADFVVEIVEDGRRTEVARWEIAPSSVPDQQRWLPVHVDLATWAGRTVDVVLRTDPGPAGNTMNDACVWGAPRVIAPEARSPRATRGIFDPR